MADDKAPLLDEARVYVKGGDGGNGAVSFRREKFVPFGGPDGGDGGSGGNVVFCADPSVTTFRAFQYRRHFKAERGGHGAGGRRHGRQGADLVVKVPLGTVIRSEGRLIADLTRAGECAVVARGGRGGRGNSHFATPTNRAPRLAEKGEPGEERWLDLELKTIADVGMVGYPNAGKSSLLAALTAARPKVGDYPFTTLAPNLGVARAGDINFVLADIPGLIAGAHRGVGLGYRFLRHVERAKVLLHVIDAASEDPLKDYESVREELRLFKPALLEKPHLVAANKMDLPAAQAAWPRLQEAFAERGVEAVPVSALTGQGLDKLLAALGRMLSHLPREAAAPPTLRVYRLEPAEGGWSIQREDGGFRVCGRRIERLAHMTDVDNPESLERLERALSRLGVFHALEEAGIRPGDTVRIGRTELQWSEELG